MKALSVRQPHADRIARGRKIHEFRTWTTDYRGPLLIAAALTPPARKRRGAACLRFPRGVAVAVVDLVDIVASDVLTPDGSRPAMYAWVLANARRVEPIPVRGRQGLFDALVWFHPDGSLAMMAAP